MTNTQTFNTLIGFFQQIYQLGDQIILFRGSGGFSVSLNQFFLAFAIFGIVIFALLNFAKSISDPTIASAEAGRVRAKRIRKESVERRNKSASRKN